MHIIQTSSEECDVSFKPRFLEVSPGSEELIVQCLVSEIFFFFLVRVYTTEISTLH